MEEEQQRHEVCPVEQVPGLYLTDWVGASSVNEVNILNVTHILTVLSAAELDTYGPDETEGVELRHLNLKDEPSSNVLQYFNQECEWLERALRGGVVLVHCQQGISRSTAIVVAYVMKKLKLSFQEAFATVRKARSIVNLNEGFREQLKVWEDCRYDIFIDSSEATVRGERRQKEAYLAWERDQSRRIYPGFRGTGTANNTPISAGSVAASKTPVREIGTMDLIDFLEMETG